MNTIYPPKYTDAVAPQAPQAQPIFKCVTVHRLQLLDYSHWQPDNSVTSCSCGNKFSFFAKWKHHCRLCGTIACNDCLEYYPRDIVRTGINPQIRDIQYLKTIWSGDNTNCCDPCIQNQWILTCRSCEALIKSKLCEIYTESDSECIMSNARNMCIKLKEL